MTLKGWHLVYDTNRDIWVDGKWTGTQEMIKRPCFMDKVVTCFWGFYLLLYVVFFLMIFLPVLNFFKIKYPDEWNRFL